MKGKGIVVAMLLIVAMFAMVMPATAKTYYQFHGHDAVRYEHNEISPSFQPFINHVEYDIVCTPGAGVRLYFTNWGKMAVVLYPGLAESIAHNIMAAPEWTGDRSLRSVKYEIIQHGIWPNRMVVDIEYYYCDLKSWELPYKNM